MVGKRVLKTALKVFAILLIVLFVAIAIFIAGFSITIDKTVYSEGQHLQRISQRIEKNYINDKTGYTDYEVYPLYDQNDEFAYVCLVEFAPTGYLYVWITNTYVWGEMFVGGSMYLVQERLKDYWQRYKLAEEDIQPSAEDGTQWLRDYDEHVVYNEKYFAYYEANENGEFIKRTESHYKEANIQNERRYIFQSKSRGRAVPAVKRGDKYLNLISMREFVYNDNFDEIINSGRIESMYGVWAESNSL